MKQTLVWVATVFFGASVAFAAIPPIDTKSSKYAAIVLDADTGELFYSRNANARRYPASLTKMMTLYLTFEALNTGAVKLDTRLSVSKKAASQPQTNISLKAGQTIRVRDAIKALVVRSANDVAVVLAEKLGKTEQNFALKMTQKARSLGMKRTQFRNPHGLPDRQQYTSAADMAKLSIALRRDFPQYYPYFKTQEFTWKGKKYKSHNRVLDRFDGVDGIKTGYVKMSGFNLASSVKRDGYHVVAVVMGGQNSRSRDSHMVSLLTKTFTKIAERGDTSRAFATAPIPQPKPKVIANEVKTASMPWVKVSFSSENAENAKNKPTAAKKKEASKAPQLKASKVVEAAAKVSTNKDSGGSFLRFVSEPSSKKPAKNSLNFQLASLKDRDALRQKWGIQVGAFRDAESAIQAASKAQKVAKSHLKYSKVSVSDHDSTSASIHRARLANLSEKQAKRACVTLSEHSTPCFVFKLDRAQNL